MPDYLVRRADIEPRIHTQVGHEVSGKRSARIRRLNELACASRNAAAKVAGVCVVLCLGDASGFTNCSQKR